MADESIATKRFTSRGQPLTSDGVRGATAALDIELPALWAVLAVETAGFGFLPDRRPRLLFERHYFHRLTQGRFDSSHPAISAATTGGYLGGTHEYTRLAEALELDEEAALQSASWGVGQVMGANYRAAGFASVAEMVAAAVSGENGQLLTMTRFIASAGLGDALRRRDWASFANGYNGPRFREHQYDTRLAEAHAACEASPPDIDLRTAQAALLYLGFNPGPIDGRMGPSTRSALQRFQEQNHLVLSGALTGESFAALTLQAFAAST